MGEPSMRTEVERIRRWYADRAVDPVIRARYAPFNEQQADSLCQQYRAVAESMRSIGRRSLADHRILDVGCGKGRFLRYWDLPTTRTPRREVLDLQELFPGMAARAAARVAIRPRPSEGLRPRFRPALRWIDRFAHPPTHNAVLLGPKR